MWTYTHTHSVVTSMEQFFPPSLCFLEAEVNLLQVLYSWLLFCFFFNPFSCPILWIGDLNLFTFKTSIVRKGLTNDILLISFQLFSNLIVHFFLSCFSLMTIFDSFRTVMLEKTVVSLLDCKEIQPVHPRGDQSWVFIGRTEAEAETPILWPPHAKS